MSSSSPFDIAVATSLLSQLSAPSAAAVRALAPNGELRAGINLSNFLLVTDQSDPQQPIGVSPDMARALASCLGVDVRFNCYASPGEVADGAERDEWDIGNIGAEPARAVHINFTTAYAEIESTCLVPEGSAIKSFAEVDQPGIRVATKHRAAYTLWLERNLQQAELVQADSIDASFDVFVEQKLEVLAGLRPRLLDDQKKLAGSRILEDKFASVQQAIGTPKTRDEAGVEFLHRFVAESLQSGLVKTLINHHGVDGRLSAAQ